MLRRVLVPPYLAHLGVHHVVRNKVIRNDNINKVNYPRAGGKTTFLDFKYPRASMRYRCMSKICLYAALAKLWHREKH